VKIHMSGISQVSFQKQMIYLTSICMSYLNEGLFLVCLVYLILCQNILDLTRNMKNLVLFSAWQFYVVFMKRHLY
jgi:hypothetical protein